MTTEPFIVARRSSILMAVLTALFTAGLSERSSVLASELVGRAVVIDGDTIEIRSQRIRLWGIDAPESNQLCSASEGNAMQCGRMAADTLASLIGRHSVNCVEVDTDRYSRSVAVCSVGPMDVAGEMVRLGYAIDYSRYSKGAYETVQAEAKAASRGLWATRFEDPGKFRECVREGGRPRDCSAPR